MRAWSSVLVILASLTCGNYVTAEEHKCSNVPCIPLTECQSLGPYFRQGMSDEVKQLMRAMHCGFSGRMPKVCCPAEFGIPDSTNNRLGPNTPSADQSLGSSRPSEGRSGPLLPGQDVCGYDTSDRILGGNVTNIREHPWTARIEYSKPEGSGFYCGGVLISSRYVLTAAHCVKGSDLPYNWNVRGVRLGEWNTATRNDCQQLKWQNKPDCADTPVDIDVDQIIPHPQYDLYDSNKHHDIALLRLRAPVSFTDFIQPICLPTKPQLRSNTFKDYAAVVAGWGQTENRSESDVKLKVELPVVSNDKCQSVYRRLNRIIGSKQLCAGADADKDSCRGDSGGPLMFLDQDQWTLIGVVSYGPTPCGYPGWPGVYTRITEYLDWINQNVTP